MDRHLIAAAVERAQMADMAWGRDDCCLWVADIVAAHKGPDIAKPFRGYRTRIGSALALKRYGGSDLLRAALKRAGELGLKEVGGAYRDGDLGLVLNQTGQALALFHRNAWVARSASGIAYLPAHFVVIAWRLPCLQS